MAPLSTLFKTILVLCIAHNTYASTPTDDPYPAPSPIPTPTPIEQPEAIERKEFSDNQPILLSALQSHFEDNQPEVIERKESSDHISLVTPRILSSLETYFEEEQPGLCIPETYRKATLLHYLMTVTEHVIRDNPALQNNSQVRVFLENMQSSPQSAARQIERLCDLNFFADRSSPTTTYFRARLYFLLEKYEKCTIDYECLMTMKSPLVQQEIAKCEYRLSQEKTEAINLRKELKQKRAELEKLERLKKNLTSQAQKKERTRKKRLARQNRRNKR